VVSRQVAAALADFSAEELKPLIIAYEPVWAIGTGKVCEAKEASRVIQIIRKTVTNLHQASKLGESVPVLYGGSVNAKNIGEQMDEADIDGSLVGGASLKADEFMAIISAAQARVEKQANVAKV
jgi:triosephosphate isomerase